MSSAPVIIEAAINGATSKERNPNVPRSPEEITADILASIDAGAAIIHNHIDLRDTSGDEAAARYLEAWRPVLEERPDALIYPTVNFASGGHNYDHIAPLAASAAPSSQHLSMSSRPGSPTTSTGAWASFHCRPVVIVSTARNAPVVSLLPCT